MEEGEEVKLVVFRLGEEEYAAEVSQVKEIIKLERITRLPRAPEFVEGVINLRGQLTTVINLRKLFNLPEQEAAGNGRIVVLDSEEPTGVIVDSVVEVLSLSRKEIEKPTSVFGVDAKFIKGVGKKDGRLIIILDMNRILSPEEVEQVKEVREMLTQEVKG